MQKQTKKHTEKWKKIQQNRPNQTFFSLSCVYSMYFIIAVVRIPFASQKKKNDENLYIPCVRYL